MFWLSTLDIANSNDSDSDNGKINYRYADLIEKEKLLQQKHESWAEEKKFEQK